MWYVLSMILSIISIILLIFLFIELIKKFKYIKEKIDEIKEVDEITYRDSWGLECNHGYDQNIGHTTSFFKSNGEFHEFENDERGNLIAYRNHLGVDYRCEFDDQNRMIYLEDHATNKKWGLEYDDNGRVCYKIDYVTGLEEWYYYNNEGKIYLTKDSEGRSSYVLSNMPKEKEDKDE